MKLLIVICVLSLVGLSLGDTVLYPRGCIYVMGKCLRECEVGTHAYTTGCGYLTKEATCELQNPTPDTRGKICDFTACYCDPPTVRDEVSKKCVQIDECPKKATKAKQN